MESIDAIAPAKANLFLAVGPRGEGGFHDVTTVMHALALHDRLHVTLLAAGERTVLFEPHDAAQPLRQVELAAEPGSGLSVSAHVTWDAGLEPEDIDDERNLACRAVRALAAALGRTVDEHVRILVRKSIPTRAGLGGGSSDAAAALVAAASLWGVDAADPRLAQVARELGADVRFFLQGGCALLDGRGEHLVRTLACRTDSVCLVKPEAGCPTASVYAAFDEDPAAPDPDALARARACESAALVPLENALSPAAARLVPELADVHAFCLQQPGCEGALLCGSGAATLAVCESHAHAAALAAAAQQRGWWARTTSFSSLRAALLPSR